VRRHSKATSSSSRARKPSGQDGTSSGRLRLTVLLAMVAALLLVPAGARAAEGIAIATVEIEGTGSGEVSSIGGYEGSGLYEGFPPIECSGPPTTGVCESTMADEGEGAEGIYLVATPNPGSVFAGWELVEGASLAGEGSGICEEEPVCVVGGTTGSGIDAAVIATFTKEGPSGPTNKRALTVTKSGTGAGAVKSKPKGIACGNTCTSADASLYKNSVVTLTEKPASGSTFTEWTGACTGSAETCTVTMSEAKSVGAKFGGTAKAIVNPKTLTLAKVDNGFETGFGTVKASGLACEADCTTTAALYYGGVTEPKPKAAVTATLSAVAAAGSTFTGWSGCDTVTEGKCLVSMSSSKTVEAEFAALPKNTLTLTKVGAGAIKSKPKGVACGNTCSSAIASLPSDTTIVLSQKAATGSTFVEWSGACSGAGETCTVTMSAAKSVTATFTTAVKPLVNPKTLTLTKAGSGYGTVKASGLACELACTSTAAAYYGGVTEPKPKAATTVTLLATSAPGSGTVSWSGCDSEPEGKCVVSMSAAKNVTATFNELE
jgi:hypothetical protein